MLKKQTIRLISLIITVVLLLTMIGGSLISLLSMRAGATSVDELESKISDIEKQKEELQAVMDDLENQIANTTEQIGVLKDQIALTQQDIEATEQIIESLGVQIEEKEVEIEEAQQKLDEQTELFETRMRVMYENGNDIGYLDVILGSNSFSDMLSRMEIVSEIMESDKKIVNDFRDAKTELENAKQALVESQDAQKEYQESLEEKNDVLEAQKEEYESSKAQLEGDYQKSEEEKAALDAEKQAINEEIEELSRKAAQQAQASGGTVYTANGALGAVSVWPAPSYTRISSNFGYRGAPTSGASTYHQGVDLAAPSNTAVLASGSGTVVKSYYSSSYGNYIAIDHGGGVITGYAHMNQRLVSVGETVSAGEQIGTIGSTGYSTGPHLHFEVYINGTRVDPMNYF